MENPGIMENPRSADPSTVQVACAGEALIDLIKQPDGRFEPCLGGAVYNLARALARQQVGTAYLNPLSSDRFGRQLSAGLLADGVQLACPEPVRAVTALAVVALDDHGHPDYAFYREGVADRAISASGLSAACAAWPGLRVVCTGALALDPRDNAHYLPWLAEQRAQGAVVVVDANLRPSVMPDLPAYRASVLAALQLADVIKASDEDLEALDVPGHDAISRAQGLLAASSARWLVLTLGSEGACLVARDGKLWRARESAALAVVDTVGAGDCFLAGLVTAVLERPGSKLLAELDDATAKSWLSRAVASASLCVMRQGCQPPSRAEVLARVTAQPCVFA